MDFEYLKKLNPPAHIQQLGTPELIVGPDKVRTELRGLLRLKSGGRLARISGAILIGLGILAVMGALLFVSTGKLPVAIALGVCAAAALILGAFQATRPDLKESFVYAIYPDHLVGCEGGKWSVIPFKETAEFRGQLGALFSDASVMAEDGTRLLIRRDIENHQQFVREVERRCYEWHSSRMIEMLQSGETVEFGALGLNQTGVLYKGKTIGWKEIEKVQIAARAGGQAGALVGAIQGTPLELRIKRKEGGVMGGYFCKEAFLGIPNRAVLIKLVYNKLPRGTKMEFERMAGYYMPEDVLDSMAY